MAIHSFLKAQKGDPEWQFTPDEYFEKQFKIIDASLVELDAGAEDSIVLRQTPTEKELLAKHLKVHVKEGAALDMIVINDVDPNLQQVFLYDIHLKPDSTIKFGIFAKDGKFNKHIIQVFIEDGASFAGYGLLSNEVGGDTEIITKLIHQGADSFSTQMFLGLAGEASQTAFQSIAITEDTAIQSEIGIESSNLVTGLGGRCFAKPETYVNSEFTVSGHGAETDTISLEKIGYFQSRGMPEAVARSLIMSGFRDQVIDVVSSPSIQDEIREMYTD